jgi:hypothetical protein
MMCRQLQRAVSRSQLQRGNALMSVRLRRHSSWRVGSHSAMMRHQLQHAMMRR